MGQYLTAEGILKNKETLIKNYMHSASWVTRSPLVHDFIEEKILKDDNVLDIGCGGGEVMKIFSDNGYKNVFGFDIDNYVKYDEIKGRVTTGDLNFEKIPFEDGYFNLITCFQVMEHLENPFHFERECARLLRPGGYLILSTPSGKSIWSRLSYLITNNITGYDLINNHITFLTADVFRKIFLKDFDNIKEIFDRGFIPYFKKRLPPHALLSKRICRFLRKKEQ